MTAAAEWIAVDWGTSNLRAWGIGANGDIIFAHTSPEGMARLTRDAYAPTLARLLAGAVGTDGPPMSVIICGMAGARQGWLEAPYLDTPADLGALLDNAVVPPMPSSQFIPRILPGVCQRTAGAEDVMRGEETQVLGLATLLPDFTGTICMPGTHSKWVQMSGRRIERFTTAMTGEIFDTLRTHSVLRHSLAGDLDGPDRHAGFEAGLAAGIEAPHKLTATLFKVRAGSLLSGRAPDWSAGFLSGVLIGAEIGGQRDSIGTREIPILGDAKLALLYARGLEMAGARSRIVDGTAATLAGLKAARANR